MYTRYTTTFKVKQLMPPQMWNHNFKVLYSLFSFYSVVLLWPLLVRSCCYSWHRHSHRNLSTDLRVVSENLEFVDPKRNDIPLWPVSDIAGLNMGPGCTKQLLPPQIPEMKWQRRRYGFKKTDLCKCCSWAAMFTHPTVHFSGVKLRLDLSAGPPVVEVRGDDTTLPCRGPWMMKAAGWHIWSSDEFGWVRSFSQRISQETLPSW